MDIPVLIEELPDQRYRARSGEPFGLTAEGATSDEALRNLNTAIQARLSNGARLEVLHMPCSTDNPWRRVAGIWKDDDPAIKEWEAIIAENRRKQDEEDGIQ